ncbi:ATP-binding protein [Streptomyces hygroscopicus subsp. hygroscopicus]|uniref:ATP-binding protein n=1 Tax=Streptomyces hygroscopicus TaxID=1912 RepID=UPI001C65C5F9|nr:ATP-binding protein [Streptomyces hygroscopicus]MBW8093257.1 ATP-binding protein [Streptomyces hygroscopicus subsp. hygroscopicus]
MVFAGTSPGGRRPASTLVWVIPPAAMAFCAALAVAVVPSGARATVAWCGAAATLAVALAAAEALRRGRLITTLRTRFAAREAELRQRLADQEAEIRRVVRDVLPVAVTRLQRGAMVDDAMKDVEQVPGLDPDFEDARRYLLRSVMEIVRVEEDLRDAAQRAFVNIARRVQAIVHQQAYDVREMEHKHGADPVVFGDLLHLDHGNALIGRLADSIAVLGGSRPGRQWQKEVPLYNVCRGAVSRILEYGRVDLHSVADVAIVGPSVEPLIHALAELLDNATRYSPPKTRVHLTAIEVQSGVAIEIEDAGVGLSEEAHRRTDAMLIQAAAGLDLNDLGETPRLGLAVVGRLAARYRFQISLRPSAYGGVRAVLVVPQDIICPTPAPGGAIARKATLPPPKPVKRATPLPSPTGTGPLPQGRPGPGFRQNGAGLPQRRRRMPTVTPPLRVRSAPPAEPAPPGEPDRPPVQPGIWLDAFHKGLNGEPIPEPDAGTGPPGPPAAPDPREAPSGPRTPDPREAPCGPRTPDTPDSPDARTTPHPPHPSDKDE